MSNMLFNIRFGTYFLQIMKHHPYVLFGQSVHWKKHYNPVKDKWLAIYSMFGIYFH